MENKIRELIEKTFKRNREISDKLPYLDKYSHAAFFHEYNVNLRFIRELEALLK